MILWQIEEIILEYYKHVCLLYEWNVLLSIWMKYVNLFWFWFICACLFILWTLCDIENFGWTVRNLFIKKVFCSKSFKNCLLFSIDIMWQVLRTKLNKLENLMLTFTLITMAYIYQGLRWRLGGPSPYLGASRLFGLIGFGN